MPEPIDLAPDDKVMPRGYIVKLPAIMDKDRRVHRPTFELFLYQPQAAQLRLDPLTHADGFIVWRDGVELFLETGRYKNCPAGWVEAFDDERLTGPYFGVAAIAALQLITRAMKRRKRKRGERGPAKTNLHAREFLLAAALACIAEGMSQREAVSHVLAEHDDVVPWPFETAEGTLRQMVKRQIGANRFFVPSPSESMR
jgi:hypothetical protein